MARRDSNHKRHVDKREKNDERKNISLTVKVRKLDRMRDPNDQQNKADHNRKPSQKEMENVAPRSWATT